MMDENKLGKNRKISKKWKENLQRLGVGILFFLLIYILLGFFPALPLGNIQVQGTSKVSQEEVLRSAGLEQVKNIFSVNRSDVRRRLDKDVRLEVVSEGYHWFTYQIVIKERTISAYVPTHDGFIAVDRNGKVLQVQRRFGYMSAPIITGITLPSL